MPDQDSRNIEDRSISPTGRYDMPREPEPGTVSAGGETGIGEHKVPGPWQAAVISFSGKCFKGERKDEAGPAIAERLTAAGCQVVERLLLPDEEALLKRHLIRLADQRQLDLILTAGGTALGPRDLVPEATLAVADRVVPGIAEAMRAEGLKKTKYAMLSRGVAVLRGKTLIVNLPGSLKASMENLDAFMDVLPHALAMLRAGASNGAQT